MNRLLITLLAVMAGLSAWGQDAGTNRDASGFLPMTATPPTMAPMSPNAAAPAEMAQPAPAVAMPAAPAESALPASVPVPGPAITPAVLPVLPANETNFITSSRMGESAVYNLDDKHKLAPGDHISFEILEDRTNATPMLVTESSELDVPYIGRYSVAGKTCKELAADLKTLLEKDYYYKATVIIGLDAYGATSGKVYVEGPVKHPGPVLIPANENFTVSKAILEAGGFDDFADKKHVKVLRKTDLGNQTLTVNVAAVFESHVEQDVVVKDGDVIDVPQRAVNFGD